jgi:zinc metalloprotease ZmpB
MPFGFTDNVNVERDPQGNVQHLDHFQQPFVAADVDAETDALAAAHISSISAPTPQALAQQYLREVMPIYGIDENLLPDQGADALAAGEAGVTEPAGGKLELAEEKDVMGTTTISYQQTYEGLPVWGAGVSVTIQPGPMRVTASQSSIDHDVSLPPEEALTGSAYRPERITPNVLATLLGLTTGDIPVINGTNRLIYRYDPDQRTDPAAQAPAEVAFEGGPPTLPLPPVPDDITPEQHCVAAELLFTLPVEGYGSVNWRAFIEEKTGAVLYLRAFIGCIAATGMIFRTDPATAGGDGATTPTAGAATLNPLRSATILEGLVNGNPQVLSGQFVRLVDSLPPKVPPPSQSNPPGNFFYDAPTREFSAVNAYHHCDWLFRHLQGMGFDIESYFDGTTFPVPVDPCAEDTFVDPVTGRGRINARAPGNTFGVGSGGFIFGLAGEPFPAVGIAADVRVVLHEFGHALLWDGVHSPNFGFAHSAGDSLAAILMDPESALRNDPVQRLLTFPWEGFDRNHGRDVAAGWGWDGVNYAPFTRPIDPAGYRAEQILSTTLFRAYRSMGGDSGDVNRRKLGARQAVYLIFRAIGSLASSPVTSSPRPEVFATELINADIGISDFEGYRGGAFHKVIRWSFEKQGLYQPPGAPRPVTTPGAPPNVDVYINDGPDYQDNPRNGEYVFQPHHWECTDIWNRLTPNAGGGSEAHQTPVVGQTNYAYVRVNNRGTQHGNNVWVRGYSAAPGAGISWPDDWTPMDTPQVAVADGIPQDGSVVVGPFRWTPRSIGHECMFMEVTADGDLSNIDTRTFFPCAAGPTPEWQLVPFDNNLAQRNVAPVPGGGGIRGLLSAFVNRRILVRNPSDNQVRMGVKAELTPFLAERGWRVRLDNNEGISAFSLASGVSKKVEITLRPGEEFSSEELTQVGENVVIRVRVYADGMIIGGMTYQLDPNLEQAPSEREDESPIELNDHAIEAAIQDARLLHEEAERGFVAADTGPARTTEEDTSVNVNEDFGNAAPKESG